MAQLEVSSQNQPALLQIASQVCAPKTYHVVLNPLMSCILRAILWDTLRSENPPLNVQYANLAYFENAAAAASYGITVNHCKGVKVHLDFEGTAIEDQPTISITSRDHTCSLSLPQEKVAIRSMSANHTLRVGACGSWVCRA